MKLVIDISPLSSQPFTGIGVILENLIASLKKIKGLDLEYFALVSRGSMEALKKQYPSAKIIPIPARLLNLSLSAIQFLNPSLDLFFNKADAVLSIDWLCLPLKSGKTAAILADMTPVSDPQWHTEENIAWFKRRLQAIEKNARLVIAITRETKDEIGKLAGIKKERIEVAYPGVPQLFQTAVSAGQKKKIAGKYGLSGDFLLFVSRLDPRKNIENIVKALESVNRNQKNRVKLMVAGNYGWSVPERYPEYVHKLNHVGHTDLPAIYSLSRGLVFPSLKEGFGMPIVEAFATGTPVLTGNCSSMKEVAGDAAILVDPYSVADIAGGIRQLLNLTPAQKQAMVKKGRERLQLFSFDRMADTIVNSIQKLL